MLLNYRDWLIIGGAAGLAGLLAAYADLPAAWLVGPMLTAVLLTLTNTVRTTAPKPALVAAQAIVGMALSASFAPSSLATIVQSWFPLLVVVIMVLLVSIASGTLLARLGEMDYMTAVLGMMPGGASSMVAMSDELQADARVVAFMQYVRLILVVLVASLLARFAIGPVEAASMPPARAGAAGASAGWAAYGITTAATIIGAWAATRCGIPAGTLVGPVIAGLVLGALGVEHGTWPPGVVPAANAVLGVAVGLRFDGRSVRQVRSLAPAIIGAILGLIAGCALLGALLAQITGVDLFSAYLATTPGGIDSVALTALAIGAQTALVLAVHLARLLAVVLAAPLLLRWLARCSSTVVQP